MKKLGTMKRRSVTSGPIWRVFFSGRSAVRRRKNCKGAVGKIAGYAQDEGPPV